MYKAKAYRIKLFAEPERSPIEFRYNIDLKVNNEFSEDPMTLVHTTSLTVVRVQGLGNHARMLTQFNNGLDQYTWLKRKRSLL